MSHGCLYDLQIQVKVVKLMAFLHNFIKAHDQQYSRDDDILTSGGRLNDHDDMGKLHDTAVRGLLIQEHSNLLFFRLLY